MNINSTKYVAVYIVDQASINSGLVAGTGENWWRLILATFVEVEGKMNWEVFIRSYSLLGSPSMRVLQVTYCEHHLFQTLFPIASTIAIFINCKRFGMKSDASVNSIFKILRSIMGPGLVVTQSLYYFVSKAIVKVRMFTLSTAINFASNGLGCGRHNCLGQGIQEIHEL